MGSVLRKREKQIHIEPLLLEVADVMATSLDLDTTLRRIAEVVRKVIDYEIFAILLLNEKTQELRFRFQIGYPQQFAERARIKVGEGVTGRAVQSRRAILIDDVTKRFHLHCRHSQCSLRTRGASHHKERRNWSHRFGSPRSRLL